MATRSGKFHDFAGARLGRIREGTGASSDSRVLYNHLVVQPKTGPSGETLYLRPPKAFTAKQTPPLGLAPHWEAPEEGYDLEESFYD